MKRKEDGVRPGRVFFRPLDFFIVVFFLFIAVFCFELFRNDLMQTFSLQNVDPVGTVVIKRNTVQRRLSDRAIWDRLASESPVYIGDLIRIADISAATLYIDANSIDLDENTIIRITRAPDGEGIQITLSEGSLSLVAEDQSKSLVIDLNGQKVQTGRGTVLTAAVSEEQKSFQVSEGFAQFVEGGVAREITAGSAVTMAADGTLRVSRAVVVTSPQPNSRYVKNSASPLTVDFAWNRINLEPNMRLRLEIAQDSGFVRIIRTLNNLDRTARTQFDAGYWYYRILYQNEVLATGQLMAADGTMRLVSPALNSIFRFQDELPTLNFQWERREEASSYSFEVSSASDFSFAQIRMQVSSPSQVISSLGEGLWYWRVKPLFPSVYNGEGAFSPTAFFRIEKTAAQIIEAPLSQWIAEQAPSLDLPPEVPAEIIPQEIIAAQIASVQVNLDVPANGAQITGLAALRQPVVFRWDTETQIESSRFIISANANPLQGQPFRVISNPARTVNIDGLAAGTWYWTVEVRTANNIVVSAPPRRLQVLPIQPLAAPANLQPQGRLGFTELQSQRSIVFRWQAVQGANAYIFTLSQQTAGGRRQIIRTTINSGTSYTLNNLRLLDRGTFVWQVEPVNIRGNSIDQRGNIGERTLIIDIPAPGPVQIEDTGILYGN
ncbi:MAG: hypothetical protein FWD26_05195 [Treponema sp.]|nr:hypothetical protein [Treponema sp.]